MGKRMQKLRAVPHHSVRIDDPFWSPKLKVMREVTLPDVFNKFETDQEGAFRNFDWVREGSRGKHVGPPWYDGLIYETMRAASDFLGDFYEEAMDRRLDGYIEKISAAQQVDADGYINTYTELMCPGNRWGENGGNLIWQHDVYNTGCLMEAAVHHYRATGKVSLLQAAVRLANHMCRYIGLPPKHSIVPAHPLPEEAFVKLYKLFREDPGAKAKLELGVREEEYFELAKFWIDNRGKHEHRNSYPRNMGEYSQDHRPMVEQDEAMGHAVRATLLYNGLIAVAMETGDEAYYDASVKLWENAAYHKMHISGGVGAVHNEEKFGYEYQLPNDAYLETCAAVGMGFWTGNMGLAFGESRYMNVFERILYNGVLPGLSLKGDKYFYRNPLQSKGDDHRWEWHGCPCCPPMYLKLMADLQSYLYAQDDEGIYVNQYIGSNAVISVDGTSIKLTQKTGFPWNGDTILTLEADMAKSFKIRLRIPDWCNQYEVLVNGNKEAVSLENGFAVLDREWKDGDEIQVRLEMKVLRMEAHPYVADDRGKVAIQRGPVLYCLEGVDNPETAELLLAKEPAFRCDYQPELLDGIVVIQGKTADGRELTAVPYYAWDNRESGTMAVWLRQDGKPEAVSGTDGWERKLYRSYVNSEG